MTASPVTTVSPAKLLSLARRHRDRLAVLAGLAVITTVAWAYIVVAARRMTSGPGRMSGHSMAPVMHAMTGVQPWTAAEFGLRLAMWAVMMVAMMVPTAVPMTLLYAAVARKAAAQHSPVAPAFVFVAGYAAMWAVFGLAATTTQWGLDRAALLSPMMVSRSAWLGAVLLIAAGVYQLTPLKNACLRNCRAPAHFLSRYWRAPSRRLPHGRAAWYVLSGLLLDLDGIAVRRRRDEPDVDRGDHRVRAAGKDRPVRRERRPGRGRRHDPDRRPELRPLTTRGARAVGRRLPAWE